MQRHTFSKKQRWHRVLGRLYRSSDICIDQPYRADCTYTRNPPSDMNGEGTVSTTEGRDVGPNMDVGPTDPEVYAREPMELPRREYEAIPPRIPVTITPTSDLIRDLLDEIDQQIESGELPRALHDRPRTPEVLPAGAEDDGEPHRSASTAATGTSSYRESPEYMEMGPPPREQRRGNFDRMQPPQHREHAQGERSIPIPQNSPPIGRPREICVPSYYRDYLNLNSMPAYQLYCLSAWYVQVSDSVVFCANCVTAEHTFCIPNRPRAYWRHMHAISRTLRDTTLHCGRCYGLLLHARRAIDCHNCRRYVIDREGRVEHLVYTMLCEIIIPYELL